jgi:hypothetical protein
VYHAYPLCVEAGTVMRKTMCRHCELVQNSQMFVRRLRSSAPYAARCRYFGTEMPPFRDLTPEEKIGLIESLRE